MTSLLVMLTAEEGVRAECGHAPLVKGQDRSSKVLSCVAALYEASRFCLKLSEETACWAGDLVGSVSSRDRALSAVARWRLFLKS